MRLINRIETRLILLIILVVVVTNGITLLIVNYANQRSIRELPNEVREFLQDNNVPPLPFQISKQLQGMLQSGVEIAIRMEDRSAESGKKIFVLQPLGVLGAKPITIELDSPQHPQQDRGLAFRTRLQQSLLIATLIAVTLGMLLALIFARRLARPLEAISLAANRLAMGNLSTRIPNPQGQDETARLARNFNHMAESLEKLESERKAMIADIAHELRTPLTVMQGRLEAIQDGVIDLQSSEIDRLHNQTKLLSRLVDDLRTLSLADAGRLTLERRPLDLREIIRTVVANFQTQAENRQIHLELTLSSQPLTTKADPDRLAQVIGNLISNALVHTPEGGTITVAAGANKEGLHVRVSDTGPGIPPEALSKVFDRFYRAEASRSRQTGGSGLGLSIVKALVELHGGRVRAQNQPKGGAEFVVQLPV